MNDIERIKELIDNGETELALLECDNMLNTCDTDKDTIYYLKGSIYRKQENWQMALNNYQMAIDINPQSPAVTARKMIINILEYYYKDQFNQ